MRNIIKQMVAGTAVLLFTASVASANFWHHGSSAVKSADVSIINNAKLGNGPELKTGDYQLKLLTVSPHPELAFYQNGRLIAQTSATLVNAGKKFDSTSIVYDNTNKKSQVITEMDLSGWNQKIMFGDTGSGAGSKG